MLLECIVGLRSNITHIGTQPELPSYVFYDQEYEYMIHLWYDRNRLSFE